MAGIYYIVFIINFLLGLMLPILPLIVSDISGTVYVSGLVMGMFMASLFSVRIVLLYINPSLVTLMRGALVSMFVGTAVVIPFSQHLFIYFVAAMLWGIGIGIEAPAMINVMGKLLGDATRGVRDHNILFAVGSCIGPLCGYAMYRSSAVSDIFLWMSIAGATALAASLITLRRAVIQEDQPVEYHIRTLLQNRILINHMITYFAICVVYGVVVAYLPVWLEARTLRIDVYFAIFWIAFTASQLYTAKLAARMPEKSMIASLLLASAGSVFLLAFVTQYLVLVIGAIALGISYGAAMFYFYRKAVQLDDDYLRKNAIALFGIIAYIGIGAGSFLFSPLAEWSLQFTFMIVPAVPVIWLLRRLVSSRLPGKLPLDHSPPAHYARSGGMSEDRT